MVSFSLFGHARDGHNPVRMNSYSLVVSGLGGDPGTTAQLTVNKKNLYDLRVDFRQSHYYFNENDAAALPNATGWSDVQPQLGNCAEDGLDRPSGACDE